MSVISETDQHSSAGISVPSPMLHIAGAWVQGNGADIVSSNPATGARLTTVASATTAQVDEAVAAARQAQTAWEDLSVARRAELMHRAGDGLAARADEAARLISLETGKTFTEAQEEIQAAVADLKMSGEDAMRHFGQVVPAIWDPEANKRIIVTHVAVGVAALLSPWNFPIAIPCELIAPALACGNTVVWKPSEVAPASGQLLAEVIIEAGFPEGVFNVVHGAGDIGAHMVAHPQTDMVGFVGSTAVGEAITRNAGIKKLLLELGGNGPIVVLEDADLDAAVEATIVGAFYCAGQVCTAAERVLVHDAVYDEFVAKLVARTRNEVKMGDPINDDVTMGPLTIPAALNKTIAHLEDAVAKGATIEVGGGTDGMFHEATVLTGVTSDMEISQDETFGPVAPIMRFSDHAEGIRLANETRFGLTGAVFTESLKSAWTFAEKMHCGTVHINETTNYWDLLAPFGGMKQSGIGRVLGDGSPQAFTNPKQITFDLSTGNRGN